MSAPDRIWAIFEAHKNPKDKVPRVFASASKTKGQEYIRSDLCTPTDERVARLVENLIAEIHEQCWPSDPAPATPQSNEREKVLGEVGAILRAALRDLEGDKP